MSILSKLQNEVNLKNRTPLFITAAAATTTSSAINRGGLLQNWRGGMNIPATEQVSVANSLNQTLQIIARGALNGGQRESCVFQQQRIDIWTLGKKDQHATATRSPGKIFLLHIFLVFPPALGFFCHLRTLKKKKVTMYNSCVFVALLYTEHPQRPFTYSSLLKSPNSFVSLSSFVPGWCSC